MKNLLRILNIVLVFGLLLLAIYLVGVCYYSFFVNVFSEFVFENNKSELFISILLCLPVFIIFCIPLFVINKEIKTKIQKLNSYVLLVLSIISIFFIGILFQNFSYSVKVIANAKNMESAFEIINFLKSDFISMRKAHGRYEILSNSGNNKINNKFIIKLAENDFIDDYILQRKDKHFFENQIPSNIIKKLVEKEVSNQIKYIDGVDKVTVLFIPPEENKRSKFIINVEIESDSNKEKINKTINSLLSIYLDSEKEINFS